MIQLTSIQAMSTAIENAKSADLLVRQTSIIRMYKVLNRANGQEYTVNFFVHNNNRFAGCTCKAGENARKCKHVAAAAGLHIMVAAQRELIGH